MDSVSHTVDNRGKSLCMASMYVDSKRIHLASLSVLPGLNASKNFEKEEMVNIYRREEQFRRLRNLSDTGNAAQFVDVCLYSLAYHLLIGIPNDVLSSRRMCPKKSKTPPQTARP